MEKMTFAGIEMSKRRKRESITYIHEAKKLDTQNKVTDQIKMLKDQLNKI